MKKFSAALAAVFACASIPCTAMVFAVNEGATYRVSEADIQQKYKPVADDLSKLLGQKVTIVSVPEYKTMAEGLAAGRYDLAYIHPSHVALNGMAANGYQLVALTKGFTDYRAHFLVRADSPVRALADLKSKKVGIPSPDSITSVLARTTLRESLKEGAETVAYVPTRYQDAIPFMVEHGLVDVGVTGSDAVAKAWTAAGGKIAFSSKTVPVKLLLAAKQVKADELAAMQGYFVGLDQSDKGRRTLETIEKKGFVSFDGEALTAVNRWIATGVK
ncbi:phosphate/phosphite/phosphonate ABC transporter substrate-binding protein [Caenimonas soli]|uniref:phosphate/phosphite/phosphonate ABC transporter substrate-binding protein n=1 Tax=Caenimonas soli TaxID=2735555 RepID=UPI001555F04F|nr:phosphate/phosphite/phosphonate ABC transporter substrate-binding protein [Caenimonas soli]NPC56258.1 phosphate/phosphite/phosphonate ABC transporter substrate-binding protein [Caenimonas soli]